MHVAEVYISCSPEAFFIGYVEKCALFNSYTTRDLSMGFYWGDHGNTQHGLEEYVYIYVLPIYVYTYTYHVYIYIYVYATCTSVPWRTLEFLRNSWGLYGVH